MRNARIDAICTTGERRQEENSQMKIFQNSPVLDGNERKYVLDCLDTNWISGGKYVTDLERYFSRYCNASYGVACSNGTASLHLALEALGIGPGDEVIVPCFTLVADANMVILAGAKPVFADVDAHTWCIEPDQIRSKITERTKAIICVHMYGHPCDMDGIAAIAKEHGLFVIEDAAQAHGTEYRGRMSGGLGDVACFSFYASKTLTSGEGGLLVTNDHTIAERAKIIRNQGFEGDGRTYVHRLMGFNYRLTNIQAAIALAQCERVREKVERKRQIRQQYEALLGKERGIIDVCISNVLFET
jgi:perosamine synthetase